MLTRILDRLGFLPKHHRQTLESQIASKVDYIATLGERNEILKTKLAEAREKIGEKQGVIDKLNLDKQAIISKLNSNELNERNEILKSKLTEARDKIGQKQEAIDKLNLEKRTVVDTSVSDERIEVLKTKLDEARSKVSEKQKVIDTLNERIVTLKSKLE